MVYKRSQEFINETRYYACANWLTAIYLYGNRKFPESLFCKTEIILTRNGELSVLVSTVVTTGETLGQLTKLPVVLP